MMNKLINKISVKERGIALIISLFFLILLFAIGLTILFRANMNKKTATALTNSDFDKLQARAAIGLVQNSISHAMKNKTSPSFDGVFGSQVGSGESYADNIKLQDDYTIRSSAYQTSAGAVAKYNGNGAKTNINGDSTFDFFDFSHDGEELDGTSTSSTTSTIEWLLYTDEGELLNQNSGKTLTGKEIDEGSSGFRLAYLIIDQTGKINPNTAVATDSTPKGLDFNVFLESSSSPYSLDSIFGGDTSIAKKFTAESQFQSLSDLYKFTSAEVSNSSYRQLAHEKFYPYGTTITYPETPVKYIDSETGEENERLNLQDIYDQSIYDLNGDGQIDASYLTDDAKVDRVIDRIPYLKNLSEKIEKNENSNWRAGQTLVNNDKGIFDTVSYDPSTESEDINLNKKIAANIKDYIDDDAIATTNYVITDPDNLPPMEKDTYCGYEGLSISAVTFITSDFHYGSGLDGTERHSAIEFVGDTRLSTIVSPIVEIDVALDLQGKDLSTIAVANDAPATIQKPNSSGALRVYVSYKASFKAEYNGGTTGGDVAGLADNVIKTFTDERRDYVMNVSSANSRFPTNLHRQWNNWSHWESNPYVEIKYPSYRGHFYAIGADVTGVPGDASWTPVSGAFAYGWDGVEATVLNAQSQKSNHRKPTYLFKDGRHELLFHPLRDWLNGVKDDPTDPDDFAAAIRTVDWGTNNATLSNIVSSHRFSVTNIKLEFDRPVILFFDLNNNYKVDQGEVVDLVELPKQSNSAYGEGGNNKIAKDAGTQFEEGPLDSDSTFIRFHPLGDPRNNTHRQNWTQARNHVAGLDGYTWDFPAYISLENHATANGGHNLYMTNPYSIWQQNRQVAGVSYTEDPATTSQLREEDLTFDGSENDAELLWVNGAMRGSGAIKSPLEVSTMSTPFYADTEEFGGIRSLAELGRISRGENWKTLNLSYFNAPQGKIASPENKYTDYESYTGYTHSYKGANQEDDDFSSDNPVVSGGDGRILGEVYIEAAKGEVPGVSTEINTRQGQTITGALNPNTRHTETLRSLLSNIKVGYDDDSTQVDTFNRTLDPAIIVSSLGDDKNNKLNSEKLDKLIEDIDIKYDNALANNVTPFDRKFTFSHNGTSDESYNPFDVRRLVSQRLGHLFTYEGTPLNDHERETLLLNAKKFMSIRYNYFSAILICEPLNFIPKSVSTSPKGIVELSATHNAKINSHYRVRAELVHDIYTNKVTILNYKILN